MFSPWKKFLYFHPQSNGTEPLQGSTCLFKSEKRTSKSRGLLTYHHSLSTFQVTRNYRHMVQRKVICEKLSFGDTSSSIVICHWMCSPSLSTPSPTTLKVRKEKLRWELSNQSLSKRCVIAAFENGIYVCNVVDMTGDQNVNGSSRESKESWSEWAEYGRGHCCHCLAL